MKKIHIFLFKKRILIIFVVYFLIGGEKMNILNSKNLKKDAFIPLTNPAQFKKVFSDEDNIGMVEYLVSSILKIPLEEVKGNLTLSHNDKEAYNEVDAILNRNGQNVHIELFMNSKPHE